MAGAPKPFQMTQMMDLLLKAARDISKAARRQVKEFDEDSFTLQLQQLVKSVASGPAEVVVTPAPAVTAPMMSSPYAALAKAQPAASNAIDLLVLAHDYWAKGKHERALEHFALAMSTDGANELADALDGINNPSEDEDEEDDDKDDKSKPKPEPKAKPDDKKDETAGEDEPSDDTHFDFDEPNPDEPDFDEPSRLRQATAELRQRKTGETARSREVARALANKMSISGRRKDRVRAARLLEG